MSIIIATLSEYPEKAQGETHAVLFLGVGDAQSAQPGFRLKVLASPNAREIGRWVSDCPLALVESALLWLARYGWRYKVGKGSMDIRKVLNEAQGLAPLVPPEHMHPSVELLGLSFAPPDQAELMAQRIRARYAPQPKQIAEPAKPQQQQYVPVAPNQYPPGLSPTQMEELDRLSGNDSADRAKLVKGQHRAQKHLAHVREVVARNEAIKAARAAAEAKQEAAVAAEAVEELEAAPEPVEEKPKPKRRGRPRKKAPTKEASA